MAELLEWSAKLSPRVLRQWEDLAWHWRPANQSMNEGPDPRGDVGMKFEEVWDGDDKVQKGVRVKEVYEGPDPDDTGGVAVGDWLVSLQGLPCSQLSTPQVCLVTCSLVVAQALG